MHAAGPKYNICDDVFMLRYLSHSDWWLSRHLPAWRSDRTDNSGQVVGLRQYTVRDSHQSDRWRDKYGTYHHRHCHLRYPSKCTGWPHGQRRQPGSSQTSEPWLQILAKSKGFFNLPFRSNTIGDGSAHSAFDMYLILITMTNYRMCSVNRNRTAI